MSVELLVTEEGAETDVDLLSHNATQRESGFRTLFRRHSRPVWAMAYSRTTDARDADELTQDAFVLLWQKRGEIEFVGESILPWLLTTVRLLAMNRVRERSRSSSVPLVEERTGAQVTSVEQVAETREIRRVLDTAISALPELDAAIVQLCLVDGLTYDEAARKLGVAHGVVRNRLSRAKRKLRNDFQHGGAE
jgi:RNA polymerase sigma-70 factor (ECF subfamily)